VSRGPKQIADSQLKGDGGIGLISMLVYEMGHVWHDRRVDAGIDGSIELRDPATGYMSNRHILVQSKASDRRFSGEDDDKFWYVCEDADIDYWMSSNIPVILICSHPKDRKAWWVDVQQWFVNSSNRVSRRVDFNKATQEMVGDITGKLFAIADPHGVAHSPVAEKKRERLVSNMLEVDLPGVVYSAKTSHTKAKWVYAEQRKTRHEVRSDFVLWGGRIYTWAPTPGTALAIVPDSAGSEMPFGELVAGGPGIERVAVRLLNAALQHDLREDCRWNNDRKFIHFRPTEDLSERRIVSTSGRERLVFKGYYRHRVDATRPAFYRHAALKAHFSRVFDVWFCELLPDYFYSDDGYREFAFADKNLAKMKRIEKNLARLGETQLWASFLQGETQQDLFTPPPERILDFGPLVNFDVDRGITDKDWLAPPDSDEDGDDADLASQWREIRNAASRVRPVAPGRRTVKTINNNEPFWWPGFEYKNPLVELLRRYSRYDNLRKLLRKLTELSQHVRLPAPPATIPRTHKLDQRVDGGLVAQLVAEYEAGMPSTQLMQDPRAQQGCGPQVAPRGRRVAPSAATHRRGACRGPPALSVGFVSRGRG